MQHDPVIHSPTLSSTSRTHDVIISPCSYYGCTIAHVLQRKQAALVTSYWFWVWGCILVITRKVPEHHVVGNRTVQLMTKLLEGGVYLGASL